MAAAGEHRGTPDQCDHGDTGQRGKLVALPQVGKRLTISGLIDPGRQAVSDAKVLNQSEYRTDKTGAEPG